MKQISGLVTAGVALAADMCCCCWPVLPVLPVLAWPQGPVQGSSSGDGAGVGKGRQIAAAIKEYWLRRPLGKRRVLWMSVSARSEVSWPCLHCLYCLFCCPSCLLELFASARAGCLFRAVEAYLQKDIRQKADGERAS